MRGLRRREGAEIGRLEDALDNAPDVSADGVVGRKYTIAILCNERVVCLFG